MALPELLHMAEAVSATPAPGAIPEADADGTLNRWAAGAGMPSEKNIALALPANKQYIAPADGWLRLYGESMTANCAFWLSSNGVVSELIAPFPSAGMYVTIPVQKGALVVLNWDYNLFANKNFYFIYVEGEKP